MVVVGKCFLKHFLIILYHPYSTVFFFSFFLFFFFSFFFFLFSFFFNFFPFFYFFFSADGNSSGLNFEKYTGVGYGYSEVLRRLCSVLTYKHDDHDDNYVMSAVDDEVFDQCKEISILSRKYI